MSRSAIVTGGARGLGNAVAARLVRDGWHVALVDVSQEVERAATEMSVSRDGARVLAFVGDVTDQAFADSAVAGAVDVSGGLDALVNCAGVGGPSDLVVDLAAQEFRRVLEVNVVGTFLMSRAAARSMIARGTGGSIVNTGSILGQQGAAGGAAYCASKGAVALFTHSLALEVAPHGIRVNTIAPGNMATEMHFDDVRATAARSGRSFAEELEAVRASVPLGRHGTGDDIAGAVAWLVSEDSSYVTGQTVGVNGGVVLT